ncbi:hypothetical protein GCM10017687_14370 [Streptomyces echinatus]
MHHSGAVDVAQGLGEAGGEFAEPVRRERAVPADVGAEVLAGDVDGGHPGAGRVGVRVHHGGREGAADLAGGGHLAAEPDAELVVVGVLGVDDLDGEPAAGGGAGEVDHPHAAAAEAVVDPVAADLRRVRVAQRHSRTSPRCFSCSARHGPLPAPPPVRT